MPELPEVETIKSGLQSVVLRQEILQVKVLCGKVTQKYKKILQKELPSCFFIDVQRRGKMLIFSLSNGHFVLLRLGMTGCVLVDKKTTLQAMMQSGHCCMVIYFVNDLVLVFHDVRRFGSVRLVNKLGLQQELEKFGVEPLSEDFTVSYLRSLVRGRHKNIKSFLLNQKYITGIGNIYVDEVLFFAGILPQRSLSSVSDKELTLLHSGIVKILKKSIKFRGTTFSDYRDAFGARGGFLVHLQVYGRQGQQCLKCKSGVIQKSVVAGRGTHFCSVCQR